MSMSTNEKTRKVRRKPVTAAELMARLQSDPEYQKRAAAQSREHEERVRRLNEDGLPIVEDLRKIGVHVDSVWDLRDLDEFPAEVIDILMKHIQLDYEDRNKEGIARALMIPGAEFDWDLLLSVFEKSPPTKIISGSKFAIGLALAAAGTEENMPEALRILRDARHYPDSCELLKIFAKSKNARNREVLVEFSDADGVMGETARKLLKRFRN